MQLSEFITLSVKHNATDLHLCCGDFPRWRIRGQITVIPGSLRLTSQWFDEFCDHWLTEQLEQQLCQAGHCDFAYSFNANVRVRATLFIQHGGLSLALRLISAQLPEVEQLGLPIALLKVATTQRGLLLVTGASGSGKSTTLTALLGHINRNQAKHIITLEDPIEYCHSNHYSLIQQRQVGEHLLDFEQGLTAALRQDPDIIVLGELRTKETIQLALTAAETGHLVMATLHTRDSCGALERLADAFPMTQRPSVYGQLSKVLSAVLAQQLIHTSTASFALFELLINTNAVANLIREGRTYQLPGQIELAGRDGMLSFKQSRLQRVAEGLLAPSDVSLSVG